LTPSLKTIERAINGLQVNQNSTEYSAAAPTDREAPVLRVVSIDKHSVDNAKGRVKNRLLRRDAKAADVDFIKPVSEFNIKIKFRPIKRAVTISWHAYGSDGQTYDQVVESPRKVPGLGRVNKANREDPDARVTPHRNLVCLIIQCHCYTSTSMLHGTLHVVCVCIDIVYVQCLCPVY
jgi:hypothetical protein